MLSEFQLFTSTWRKTPSNHNVGSAWKRHLTLTSGQRDPNSWRTRSFAKSKRAWMTASSPICKSHKKMKLLKSWKRADARLHNFTWVNSFDPGNRDPCKRSRLTIHTKSVIFNKKYCSHPILSIFRTCCLRNLHQAFSERFFKLWFQFEVLRSASDGNNEIRRIQIPFLCQLVISFIETAFVCSGDDGILRANHSIFTTGISIVTKEWWCVTSFRRANDLASCQFAWVGQLCLLFVVSNAIKKILPHWGPAELHKNHPKFTK